MPSHLRRLRAEEKRLYRAIGELEKSQGSSKFDQLDPADFLQTRKRLFDRLEAVHRACRAEEDARLEGLSTNKSVRRRFASALFARE